MADKHELAGIALRAAVSCRGAARRQTKPRKKKAFRKAAQLWDDEAKHLRAQALLEGETDEA